METGFPSVWTIALYVTSKLTHLVPCQRLLQSKETPQLESVRLSDLDKMLSDYLSKFVGYLQGPEEYKWNGVEFTLCINPKRANEWLPVLYYPTLVVTHDLARFVLHKDDTGTYYLAWWKSVCTPMEYYMTRIPDTWRFITL